MHNKRGVNLLMLIMDFALLWVDLVEVAKYDTNARFLL